MAIRRSSVPGDSQPRTVTSVLPFGTIDTPGQGVTVSGTIVNFGWALTPQPRQIRIDGTTIDVLIDDVVVGHPVYSDGAVGYFFIDTTQPRGSTRLRGSFATMPATQLGLGADTSR